MDGGIVFLSVTFDDNGTERRFGRDLPKNATPEMIEAAFLEIRCRAAAYFAKKNCDIIATVR